MPRQEVHGGHAVGNALRAREKVAVAATPRHAVADQGPPRIRLDRTSRSMSGAGSLTTADLATQRGGDVPLPLLDLSGMSVVSHHDLGREDLLEPFTDGRLTVIWAAQLTRKFQETFQELLDGGCPLNWAKYMTSAAESRARKAIRVISDPAVREALMLQIALPARTA